MKLFEKLFQSQQSTPENTSEFQQSISNNASEFQEFNPEQAEYERQRAMSEAQLNIHGIKLKAAIIYNEQNKLLENEFSLFSNQLNEFNERVKNDEASVIEDEKAMITTLATPLQDENLRNTTLAKLARNYNDILSIFREDKDPDQFLEQYPTPPDFREVAIEALESSNMPEETRNEFAKKMDMFEYTIYGKRREYWDAAEQINADAKK